MLLAQAASGIDLQFGRQDGRATRVARAVRPVAESLQRGIHVVQDASRLGQLGFVALFHDWRVPRPHLALRILSA